ncbi:MAG TPA: GNAT family N-acetyltransferase [Thermoanaerobaculia bacterium]|nr:GNAT family N-acetyltransferase [Thermoanaerobaculia bacterium]
MEIVELDASLVDAAAQLLVDEFASWPALDVARAEVEYVLREGFARGAVDGGALLGWIGGLPEYDGHVWELHPLVVRRDSWRRGIGRRLVAAFEAEARARGAYTATLGTDDVDGMTSLSNVDLYRDIPAHLRDLRDLGRAHPFLFYRKLSYVVTGVMPDANGPGKPDIYMSKRL